MSALRRWLSGVLILGLICAISACAKSPEELLARAQEFARNGDPASAVVDLKNALQEQPNFPAARRLLGEQYLRLGDADAAIKELQRAVDQGEAEQELLPLILRAELERGDAPAVLDRLGKMNADQLSAPMWVLRGDALLLTADLASAREAFGAALRLDAKSSDGHLGMARIAWAENDNRTADREFALALQLDPKSVRGWLAKGDFMLARRNFAEAVKAFEVAVEEGQGFDRLKAGIGLARTHLFSGDKVKAQERIDLLLKQAPELPMPHYLAAMLAYQKQEFPRAEEQLAIVLSRLPDHIPSIYLRGTVLAAQEKWLQAEQDLSRVVSLVPSDLQSRKLLATVYLRQEQFQRALEVLENGQSLGANDPQFHAMLGGVYMRLGQSEKGMATMERAAELAPNRPEFRTQVALGHLATGDSALAVEQLRSAATQSAEDMRSDVLLVMVLLQQRKFDEAIAEAQRLIKENPKDPIRFNLLAAGWIGKGNDSAAEAALKQALALDPKFGPAKLNLALLAQRRNDNDGAYRLLLEAFNEDKTNYRALTALVQLEFKRGRTQQAIALLEKVRLEQPKALEPRALLLGYYTQLRNYDAALSVANEALGLQPGNPGIRLQHARTLLALQRYGEAAEVLEALNRDTSNEAPDVLFELARARMAMRGLPEARRATDRAIEVSGGKHVPSLSLAVLVALEDGRLDDAKARLAALRTQAGNASEVTELTGDVAAAEKRYADAETAYRAAMQTRASSLLLAKLANNLQRSGRVGQAITEVRTWLQRYPRDTGAMLQLGDMYMAAGQKPQARTTYEALLRASPENPYALNNLAWLLFETGDRRASAMADKALRLLPNHPEIMDTAAWLRFKGGNKDGVLSMLQKAAERSPNPEIRYHMAEVYAAEGDRVSARRELDRILAPGTPAFTSRSAAEALRRRM